MSMNIMEVILDTNFLISCVRKKIDFIDELEGMGFKVVVPKEVFEEMKDLKFKVGPETNVAMGIAVDMIEKKGIKKIKLGGKVDVKLIAKGREGVYIATLDNEIKRNVSNKIVIDNARNGLRIERD
jgi:rRNA-processing protein FCF1